MLKFERILGNWSKEHTFGFFLFQFGSYFAVWGLGQKNVFFSSKFRFEKLIKSFNNKCVTPNYIVLLHMT